MKETKKKDEVTEEVMEETVQETAEDTQPDPMEELNAKLREEQENHLRLAAEYDNFRKRTQKEREALYTDIKAETVGKFLPVFDNLQRALAQETADEAYKKGVEMTMTGLLGIMEGLGVSSFGEVGEEFDPNIHNAVMMVDDENHKEGEIVSVFQKGYRKGDKIIRYAMVTVAN